MERSSTLSLMRVTRTALFGKPKATSRRSSNLEILKGEIQDLLDAYSEEFVPEQSYPSDDVERIRIRNGLDDGRPMIQCSNGRACLMDGFHLECIGMHIDEIPKEQGLSAYPSA